MVLPHADQVLGAEDECFQGVGRVLKQAREGGRHEGLAEADHVADDDAAAFFKVAGGDLDRGGLEVKEGIAEIGWQGELGEAGARLLGQVIRHFDVYVIWRDEVGPGPAFFDDLDEFFGDVDAPVIAPAVLEPLGQLSGGVVVEDVHVQLALMRQAGEGEVAAAQVADAGVVKVVPEAEVKLGVKRVPEKEPGDELAGFELGGQAAETGFVGVVRGAHSELVAEFLGKLALEASGGLVVHWLVGLDQAEALAEFLGREALHADKEAALVVRAAGPLVDRGSQWTSSRAD